MSRNSNSTTTQQGCAACKHQHRKCSPDCVLAPYFPLHLTTQFFNAHKLYGVSNMIKIIRKLSPHEKDIAMATIIFESDTRARDKVGGCFRATGELQRQIFSMTAKLNLLRHQISICRAQAHQNRIQMQEPNNSMPPPPNNYASYYQQQDHHQDQYQYMEMIERFAQYQDLQEDRSSNAWVMQDSMSSLNIKQQPFGNECVDDDERNQLKLAAEETVEHISDIDVLNEGRVISEEENASIHHQDHDLEPEGAATLFPPRPHELQ